MIGIASDCETTYQLLNLPLKLSTTPLMGKFPRTLLRKAKIHNDQFLTKCHLEGNSKCRKLRTSQRSSQTHSQEPLHEIQMLHLKFHKH